MKHKKLVTANCVMCTFPIVFRGDDANCPCSELFSIANWAIIMMQFAVGLQYIIILGFSRACLGKIIIFTYEWLKKTVFHHGRSLLANPISSAIVTSYQTLKTVFKKQIQARRIYFPIPSGDGPSDAIRLCGAP